MANPEALPELDMRGFLADRAGAAGAAFVEALLEACHGPGFRYLRGHGVPPELDRAIVAIARHHVQRIDQLDAKQYDEEAATWAAMKDHMYVIADALTSGIAKQFPEKFQ